MIWINIVLSVFRLRRIEQLFRSEFTCAFGVPKADYLETFVILGLAALKTSECKAWSDNTSKGKILFLHILCM